jgi:hypothetical protein
MAQIAAENLSLSSQMAQARSAQALSTKQTNELLRLRGEVARLRKQQREMDRLRSEPAANRNRQLDSPAGLPSTASNIPKGSWAFAGYGSPEAALESLVWAMSKGDLKALLDSATPETGKLAAQEYAGKTESEIAVSMANEIEGVADLPLQTKKVSPDGAVSFTLAARDSDDGKTKMHEEIVLTFVNVGGEWKCNFGASAGNSVTTIKDGANQSVPAE